MHITARADRAESVDPADPDTGDYDLPSLVCLLSLGCSGATLCISPSGPTQSVLTPLTLRACLTLSLWL